MLARLLLNKCAVLTLGGILFWQHPFGNKCNNIQQKLDKSRAVVAHTFNARTWEAEEGSSL